MRRTKQQRRHVALPSMPCLLYGDHPTTKTDKSPPPPLLLPPTLNTISKGRPRLLHPPAVEREILEPEEGCYERTPGPSSSGPTTFDKIFYISVLIFCFKRTKICHCHTTSIGPSPVMGLLFHPITRKYLYQREQQKVKGESGGRLIPGRTPPSPPPPQSAD